VGQDPEAGQSGGKLTRDSVRNGKIERRYPPFAEPDQENWSQQEYQKRDDQRGD
jgi:hypothetical protein